jgi:hypothetical protein
MPLAFCFGVPQRSVEVGVPVSMTGVPKFVMAEIKKQIDRRRPDDLVFGMGADYLPRPKSNGGWFAGAVDSLVKNAKLSKHSRKQCIWHEQAEGWAGARPRPGRWTTRI